MENLQTINPEIINNLVLNGDLSKMTDNQKTEYITGLCHSLELNPLTEPFKILKLQGKDKLYATKDCTEQLRKINGVSITDIEGGVHGKTLYKVTVKGEDKTGRKDVATGVLSIDGLKGDAMANAIMKCETKAKRRLTLSICGLGILDESEIETIPDAIITEKQPVQIEPKADPAKLLEEYDKALDKFRELVGDDQILEAYLPVNWTDKQKSDPATIQISIDKIRKKIIQAENAMEAEYEDAPSWVNDNTKIQT